MNLPSSSGPWMVLIHDPGDGDDPKWLLAVIAGPADVRPAGPGEEPDDLAAAWLRARNGGGPHRLIPMPHAQCWRIDDGSP